MVYEIIKDLENEPSTNAKLDILKANSDNRMLRQFFLMALNPHMTFGIKAIPDHTPGTDVQSFLGEAMQGLYQLIRRDLTGNAAINYLRQILNSCKPDHADLICRIITKDPNCGVGYKAVNKVWKNLIPVTPYMRCSSANDKNYNRINYPAIAQKKANGVFLNVILRNEQVEVQSRNGKVLELHNMLDDAVLALLTSECYFSDGSNHLQDFVIHGEGLVLKEGRKIDDVDAFLDRKTGNGIINKAIQGTITPEEASRIVIECWDFVEYHDWVAGTYKVSYKKRYDYLWHIIVNTANTKLTVIETREVNNFKEAAKFYNELLQRGEEGAVLKNLSGIWKNHTSPDQVKMKVKDPADLLCVGTQPHSKKEGWIGALILESSDGIIKVKTGTGLTEVDRQKSPDYYIGKIIEMEYNEITDDKSTGQKSLFLPVYVGVREDKDEADDYQTILERSTVGKEN